MNKLPNPPSVGSLLARRRPIINVPILQSLIYYGCERCPVDKFQILPWTTFTFGNITNAYGDVLEETVTDTPLDELLEVDCKDHSMMVQMCFKPFITPTAICLAISLGKFRLCPRFFGTEATDMNLAYAEARELKEKLPDFHFGDLDDEKLPDFYFRDNDHVHVLYNANEKIHNPFVATFITVPSCAWDPYYDLATANREQKPQLAPIQQLAACAWKIDCCFSFILGDRFIVVLHFFRTEADSMGMY